MASSGNINVLSLCPVCPVSYITKFLYLPISLTIQLRSLWNFKLNLPGYQLIIPTCLIQVGYPQMVTIRHGVVPIIKKWLYLCQFNLDLHDTLNLSPIKSYYSNFSNSCGLPLNGYHKTGVGEMIKKSFPNQLGSLWNFKVNLLWHQLIIPICLIQVVTTTVGLWPYHECLCWLIWPLRTWGKFLSWSSDQLHCFLNLTGSLTDRLMN